MHFLTVSLFLSFFLVTQATDLSSELNQPPLSESAYLFVVNSDADIDDIKSSFNVTGPPRHSFRVIGENTYYFVLASNSTTALRRLTFPKGSCVTQYPVAHVNEYLKMFGIDHGYEENDTEEALPDTVLTYAEWDYDFPKGTPVKLMDLIMAALAKRTLPVHSKLASVMYIPIAYYPIKTIGISTVEDNAHQYCLKDVQDVVGGIGIMITEMKHVVKIKMA